jgi:hypothetical protein
LVQVLVKEGKPTDFTFKKKGLQATDFYGFKRKGESNRFHVWQEGYFASLHVHIKGVGTCTASIK